jgi:hypothetical protein
MTRMTEKTHRRALVTAGAVTLLAVGAGAGAVAASHGAGDSSRADRHGDVDAVRAAERARLSALVSADMATAERLHAPDFELVTPLGEVLDRAAYLGSVKDGSIDYRTFEPVSEMEVRLQGEVAAVRYQAMIDIAVEGIGRLSHPAWHTYVYEQRDGRWQAVWEQATADGPVPEPR